MLKSMTIVALVLSSFFPLILWAFFAVRARYMSVVCLILAVLSSLGAIAVASLAQVALDPVKSLFPASGSVLFSSFVESALIEELSKLAMLVWLVSSPLVYRLCGDGRYCGARHCQAENRWILSCALTLGLGFSAFETVAYAVMNPDIVWLRGLTALFVHASTAVVAGALVAVGGRRGMGVDSASNDETDASLSDGDSPRSALVPSLVLFAVAIALHGTYNAALSFVGFVPAAFIVLALVALAVHAWGKFAAS